MNASARSPDQLMLAAGARSAPLPGMVRHMKSTAWPGVRARRERRAGIERMSAGAPGRAESRAHNTTPNPAISRGRTECAPTGDGTPHENHPCVQAAHKARMGEQGATLRAGRPPGRMRLRLALRNQDARWSLPLRRRFRQGCRVPQQY